MLAKTPEEVDALFEKYVNAGNLDSLVDLYEPGAALSVAPGEVATGHEEIRAALKGFIDAKAKVKLNVTQTSSSGDVAATYNDGPRYDRPRRQARRNGGKAIEIVRKQPDGPGASSSTTRSRATDIRSLAIAPPRYNRLVARKEKRPCGGSSLSTALDHPPFLPRYEAAGGAAAPALDGRTCRRAVRVREYVSPHFGELKPTH